MVIVDPFVACHRVEENDNGAIELVAKAWANIAEKANCAVTIVHHSRKTYGNPTAVDDGRGASALVARARIARTLNKMNLEEAKRAGISDEERWQYVRLDIGKSNLAPPPQRAQWFRLVNEDLGNGDSVRVVAPWGYPETGRLPFSADTIHQVQEQIKKGGPWRKDQRAEHWVGEPIAAVLGLELPRQKSIVNRYVNDFVKKGFLKAIQVYDKKQRKQVPCIGVGEDPGGELPVSKLTREGAERRRELRQSQAAAQHAHHKT